MALSLIDVDPNTHKENFIEFLKNQTIFKDYNFEDSNINVLLDLLAHNTYLNTFYKNMIYNESQLDTALLRDSVVSQAKELNYTPQSRKSSTAVVNVTIDADNINMIEIPKGTQFSGRSGVSSYTFTTSASVVTKSANKIFEFKNLEIHEGNYLSDVYIVDSQVENQEFIINDPNVDALSISVIVLEDGSTSPTEYTRVSTLYNLNPESTIYFLEGYFSNRYKIIFGNDIFGKKPSNGSKIIISYRSVTGIDSADNIQEFNLDEDVAALNGGILNNITIETVSVSSGGAERETIENIKFNAPRYYAAQERAVSAEDFKSLLLKRFSSDLQSISVYGGENAIPKQYGKTIIAIKPKIGDIIPDFIKNNIYSYIKDFSITRPILINSDSIFLQVNSTVKFDPALTSKLPSELESLLYTAIKNYSTTKLEEFDADFRYSKFSTAIDNIEPSIISNSTEIKIVKRLYPKTGISESFLINFENAITGITSTSFTYLNDLLEENENCYFDDENGRIRIFKYADDNSKLILNKNAGTIDYSVGEIKINQVIITDVNKRIDIIGSPVQRDVIASTNKIITIDINDVTVELKKVDE